MKKKIFSLLLITVLSLTLIGCGGDKVNESSKVETSNGRFVNTGDVYDVGHSLHVYYDSKTRIVYLIGYANSGGVSPMLNKDKQPMTIDEYNAIK